VKYENTLIIYDKNYEEVCFICKENNNMKIFSKNSILKSFVKNIVNEQVYKSIGEIDGDVFWDSVEKVDIDDPSYIIFLYDKLKKNLFAYQSKNKVFIDFINDIKRDYIDKIIRRVWLMMIPEDYDNKFLLYEDSLKNSLYYHLRVELTELMKCTKIRIYPEYQTYRKERIRARIDIAIVEFSDFPEEGHLADAEIEILSAIEIKYVQHYKGDNDAINSDVKKCINYLDELHGQPQIYLTVIQEAIYNCNELSFLEGENIKSRERMTELLGYIPLKNEESENMVFRVR
jgi:hypothetical protein